MPRNVRTCAWFVCLSFPFAAAIAQDARPAADAKGGPLPAANTGDSVLVKREAAKLIDPQKYRTPLYLEPYQTVALVAPHDAVVRQIPAKPNARVTAQSELVRLDNTAQKLTLQRAQALYKAATIEQKLVDKSNENLVALAQAKVDAAKADVDLAQYQLEQSTLRAPLSGEVLRILVTEGQTVRAGEPLLVVGDVSKLKVEVPVERSAVEKDKPHAIKVESAEVQGKVEAVLPLHSRFDALRDLFESVASATIVVDNADGKYKPGQTVYVPLIPRHPVVEVPSASIGNLADGQRRVQVLRQWVVRDLPVVLMGGIGSGRLYVSGPFADADEVIYETSHQLPDGYQMKPYAGETKTATGAAQSGAPGGAAGAPKSTGAGF